MIKTAEGTVDMLPDEAAYWRQFTDTAAEVFGVYGYVFINTPLIEQTGLFVRGIGEATDVVSKEMFTAISGGNLKKLQNNEKIRSSARLSLRPEGTAGVARAVVQHAMVPQGAAPVKLMYAGPMFRAERPQAGRQRQFMQVGVECMGASAPSVDAEAIIMLMQFYERIGFNAGLSADADKSDKASETNKTDIELVINSMGCSDCRPKYKADLKKFLESKLDGLCETCQERSEKNPLRTLDCKCESCQEILKDAPKISDYLCDDCREHYNAVKSMLDFAGVPYVEDSKLVRGLDYYTRTVFEVRSNNVGSQDALAGGGRYDGLVEQLGGQKTPGFGFALGYERTLLALKNKGFEFEPAKQCKYFIAVVDKNDRAKAFEITHEMRQAGINCEIDHQDRSLKSQFKIANKLLAKYTIVLGPDELEKGQVTVRNMDTHEQVLVDIDKLTKMEK